MRCVSSAALARAKSCGSIPPGAVGASDGPASGCGGAIPGALRTPKSVAGGVRTPGNTLELAAEEMIAPAAPMAPRRNISLRFNDTPCPPKMKGRFYHSMG